MKKVAEWIEKLNEWGGTRRDIAFLAVSGIALLISILGLLDLPVDPAWVAILLCGVPILLEALHGLITAFDIKADVLVSIALVASVIIGEDFAAGEVAFIMQPGALLEELTVARARAGIEKLVKLTPRTARVLHDGQADILPAEQVRVGDLVRVLPGETIPVDGVIVSGQTSVNQAIMTGESMPVDKSAGDSVASGTVNQFGSIDLRAGKVGEDSSIQRMIRLVQTADAGKAKIVGLADRWATWIVVIALSAAVLTWLFTGQIIRAVTILVVFCPCALVLATPTAIMAAIGNATHHGFLVREGDALERLASVRRVAFDKTGTLTLGAPRVAAVHTLCPELDEAALFTLVAAAEQLSEHPLGKAIVTSWRENGAGLLPAADQFQMLPGRGVQAVVEGQTILAGNRAMLAEQGIPLPQAAARAADASLEEGCTVIYIACDNRAVGLLALSDTVRPEAHAALAEVQALGVEPVLLTGDNEKAARHLARQLGINSWHAGCLPQDKLRYMDDSLAEGQPVAMIGDGINDAPALKRAQVGIAMGGIGSDIAVEAADIALINDDLRELPHLVALSRRMMFVIRCNLTFSMALNFLAITLAITGLLNPVVGALVHNAGSVFVILHSAFLLGWRRHRTAKR
ncbi:MAG TPA: cation-translocating P-type ATPase [Candidatus Gemmiger avicola]|uniref:Cd(2+)-exporting ATPase n=1 Tax=Candidatus Gemmiger avicola TaxID=2838605 RepID=A0A9D2M6V3_9FIRM|nr:cation-translocating P-type ATPase [Candidatus Gemmiger avicola]